MTKGAMTPEVAEKLAAWQVEKQGRIEARRDMTVQQKLDFKAKVDGVKKVKVKPVPVVEEAPAEPEAAPVVEETAVAAVEAPVAEQTAAPEVTAPATEPEVATVAEEAAAPAVEEVTAEATGTAARSRSACGTSRGSGSGCRSRSPLAQAEETATAEVADVAAPEAASNYARSRNLKKRKKPNTGFGKVYTFAFQTDS